MRLLVRCSHTRENHSDNVHTPTNNTWFSTVWMVTLSYHILPAIGFLLLSLPPSFLDDRTSDLLLPLPDVVGAFEFSGLEFCKDDFTMMTLFSLLELSRHIPLRDITDSPISCASRVFLGGAYRQRYLSQTQYWGDDIVGARRYVPKAEFPVIQGNSKIFRYSQR